MPAVVYIFFFVLIKKKLFQIDQTRAGFATDTNPQVLINTILGEEFKDVKPGAPVYASGRLTPDHVYVGKEALDREVKSGKFVKVCWYKIGFISV